MAHWLRKRGGKSRAERRRQEGRKRASLRLEPLEHRLMLDGSNVISSSVPDLDGAVNIDVSSQYSSLKRVKLSSGTDVFFVGPYTGGSRQDVDFWKARLEKDQTLEVKVTGVDHSSAGKLNPELRLFDADGTPLSGNQGANGTIHPHLRYKATRAGWYYLGISGDDNNFYDPNVSNTGRNGSTGAFTVHAKRYYGTSTGTGGLTPRMTYQLDSATDALIDLTATGADGELRYVQTRLYRGTDSDPTQTIVETVTDYGSSSASTRIRLTGQEPGQYFVHVKARETSGDEEYGPGDLFQRITVRDDDSTRPTVDLWESGFGGKSWGYDDEFLYLNWSVSDNSGIQYRRVEVYREGQSDPIYTNTTSNSGRVNIAGYGPGKYKLQVTAWDADADRPGDSLSRTRTLGWKEVRDDDTTPPSVVLDGGDLLDGQSPYLDGQRPYLDWRLYDSSGLQSRVVKVYKAGVSGPIYSSGRSFSGSVLRQETGTVDLTSSGLLAQYGPGVYTIEVTAWDRDRDYYRSADVLDATESYSITVEDDDTGAPVITLGGSEGTQSHGDQPFFSWNVVDKPVPGEVASGIATVEATLTKDGVPVPGYTSGTPSGTFSLTGLGVGVFRLHVQATERDNEGWAGDQQTTTAPPRTVVLTNDPPVANAGLNQTAVEGVAIRLDARGSTDADGDALTYRWDFGDGQTGSGAQPLHAYQDNGSYRATVTVDDGFGEVSSDSVWITVLNADPEITGITNSGPVAEGAAVTITVAATDAAGDDPLNYQFDFDGDGSFEVSNTTGIATHTFPAHPDVYPVNVRVSDDDGGVAHGWTAVQVGDASPILPDVSFSASTSLVDENGTVSVEARLSEPVANTVLVPLQLGGTASPRSDYSLPYTYLRFESGSSTATLDLAVTADTRDEYDETISLTLLEPVNARINGTETHTITVADDDAPPEVMFTASTVTVDEDQAAYVLTARVSEISGKEIVIPLQFAGTASWGDDFLADQTELRIEPEREAASTVITIIDDATAESNETILVSMETPTHAALSTAAGTTTIQTITIPENDAPSVSLDAVYRSVDEGAGTVRIQASLSAPWPFGGISVPVSLSGSATLDTDYTVQPENLVLTFPAGETTAALDIELIDDSLQEPVETVEARLLSPSIGRLGATASHLLEIRASDIPEVFFYQPHTSRWEDTSFVSIPLKLTRPAGREGVLVPVDIYHTSASSDEYTFTRATAEFQPFSLLAYVTFELHDDAVNEPLDTISLRIRAAENARVAPENPRAGRWRTHTLKIRDNDPLVSFERSKYNVSESSDSMDVAVRLSAPTNRDVTVNYAVSGNARLRGDYTLDDSSITIPGNGFATKGVLRFRPIDDSIDEVDEVVGLTITSASNAVLGQSSKTNVEIQDNDGLPKVSFDFESGYHREGDTVDVDVELSGVSSRDVTVPIHVVLDGAETQDFTLLVDGVPQPKDTVSLTIPAGQSRRTLQVDLHADGSRYEGCETIGLLMGWPENGRQGTDTSVSVVIVDTTSESVDREAPLFSGQLAISGSGSCPIPGQESEPSESSGAPVTVEEGLVVPSQLAINIPTTGQAQRGYIAGGVVFFDANKNGIRDFLDLNFDGIQDPNEPTEVAAVTAEDGSFQFAIPAAFDLDLDGEIQPAEGQLAVAGGTDTATGFPLQATLLAPVGFTQITPLSTLAAQLVNARQLTPDEASTRVQEAFGFTPVALHAVDMLAGVPAGNPDAPQVFRENTKTFNSMMQLAHLVSNIPDAPPLAVVADAVTRDLAVKIATPGSALDLSQPIVMESVLSGVLAGFGLTLPEADLRGAATVVAAGNEALDAVEEQASEAFLRNVVQAEVVALGTVAPQLAEVAEGTASISDVISANTGTALQTQIDAAAVGNILPVIIEVSSPRAAETDSGQHALEFTVNLSRTPAQPIQVAYVSADGTATVEDGDYTAVSGTLTWEAGDASSRTVLVPVAGDVDFEFDERMYLYLENPRNAMLQAPFAVGEIVNDDPLHYTAPADGSDNLMEVRVDGSTFHLVRNGQPVLGGKNSGTTPVSILGVSGVDNQLVVEYASPGNALRGGLTFLGGDGPNDVLRIRNASAPSATHHVQRVGQGVFDIDGATIAYSGVESVSDVHTPTLNAPYSHPEGSVLQLSVAGADDGETYNFQWDVSRDGQSLATGVGAEFSYLPTDDGTFVVSVSSTAEGRTPGRVSQTIQVDNVAPTIAVGGASAVEEGRVFTLNLGAVTDPGDDVVTDYVVDWGDGTSNVYQAGGDVTHVYADGPRPVTIVVDLIDDDGTHMRAGSHELSVLNTLPTLDAGADQTISEGDTLHLDPAAFHDLGTLDTHSAIIDWGDGVVEDGQVVESPFGPAGATTGANGTIPGSHVYADNGTYQVTVTVWDDDMAGPGPGAVAGTDFVVDTLTVTVNNVAPVFTATSKNATFDVVENSADGVVVGTVSATDPGDDTLTYRVAGGTGAGAFTIDAATGVISVLHSALLDFETTEVFTLELTVTDDDGATDTANITVNLLNQASITGTVYVDTDRDGLFDANEMGIDDVIVELLDAAGAVLESTRTTQGGFYLFEDLDPGQYHLRETQPTGVDDGEEQLGSLGGALVANDQMRLDLERTDAYDYVFAELGQQLGSGDTAGIGFWQNKHGQQLITEGGAALAGWLSTNFRNVFGDEFAGADGADVARFYRDQLFKQRGQKVAGPAKVDAQFMAVALAAYFTNRNLAGDVATSYGFNVTDTGIGTRIVNVGERGAAFGVGNHAERTIMQLLLATDALTDRPDNFGGFAYLYDRNGDGTIDAEEAVLRTLADEVFSLINESGGLE